jgi:alpha-L-rhamnosidase
MVPENRKNKVLENLVNNVSVECSGHFGSGIYGTSFLADILCDHGHADVAYSLFRQKTYPGFGHQILDFDATTTWEQWGVIKTGREMQTYDHAMFSGADKTFFTKFGGICPLVPGYKTILIKPCIPDGLDFVRSSVKTSGPVISNGKIRQGV